MNKLTQYLTQIRPAVSLRAIELLSVIPEKTIERSLTGQREMPDKHIPAIIEVLCKYFGRIEIEPNVSLQFIAQIGCFLLIHELGVERHIKVGRGHEDKVRQHREILEPDELIRFMKE